MDSNKKNLTSNSGSNDKNPREYEKFDRLELIKILADQKEELEESHLLITKHVQIMEKQKERIAELIYQNNKLKKIQKETKIDKKQIDRQRVELEKARKEIRKNTEVINNQIEKIEELNKLIANIQTPIETKDLGDPTQHEFLGGEHSKTPKHLPSNKIIIELENVSLHYATALNNINSLKELFSRFYSNVPKQVPVAAIKNMDLEIFRGQVIGIVGRNGAGKSTLLKLLSRILIPSKGKIRIAGRPSPLLAVGAGFHPELTGLENIFLYSSILGNTIPETSKILDKIIDYSELSTEVIQMPLRTYSAGMSARLAFSVAMAKQPEILLVDEVLAVGDLNFQKKCLSTFAEYKNNGSTILLVTHNPAIVQKICNRAIWIEKGEVRSDGEPNAVMDRYISFMSSNKQQK